ncbi:MAG TPA: exodeoxyribonuclease VII large subunit [Frankiaceae bacterium]|nr:exodeoxyribonuclease VII large subunit [Frankiaceae bacterium]
MTERGARLDGERRLLQVGDVLRAIEDQFHTAFPRRIWVCGILRGLRGGMPDAQAPDGRGIDAFVLVEESDDGIRTLPCELLPEARLAIDDSLRRLHDVAVDDLLVDGHFVRAGGLLSYDPARHCAIFEVTALDPQPTAAWLADRREQVRSAASSARLAERQRDLRVPTAPSSIALVAACGDPALEESRQQLEGCGFDVEVKVYAPTIAGSAAGDQLANGLREAALAGHDLVLLLRQDGRPLSLAPFDSEAVVRAVATSTTPVLSGLGSPEEPAAVEEVSHQAYSTAQEATASVIRRLQRAHDLVEDTVLDVADAADEAIRRAARRLEQTRHGLAEDIRQATARTMSVRARRMLWIRVLAGVLALAIVAGAVVTQVWLILAALVVPLGIALAAPRLRTKRRRPVTVTQFSFSEALEQLANIGRQLREVADPDDVRALEVEADALAAHCRALLRSPRTLRANAAPRRSEPVFRPAVTADGGVITGPASEAEPIDMVAVEDAASEPAQPSHTVVLPADPVRSQQR